MPRAIVDEAREFRGTWLLVCPPRRDRSFAAQRRRSCADDIVRHARGSAAPSGRQAPARRCARRRVS